MSTLHIKDLHVSVETAEVPEILRASTSPSTPAKSTPSWVPSENR